MYHILMPYNMIVLNFRLLYFHASNIALFLQSILVRSFNIDVAFTFSTRLNPT